MNLENIVKMTQKQLKSAVEKKLNQYGYKTKSANGYLYAAGDLPVLLVAHLDTIHKNIVKEIFYSKDNTKLMSPQGIGGDDRSGVYIIMNIVKNLHCHVLFCEDEEIGGIGAKRFTKDNITPEVNYIIEIDRQGSNDAVFYSCDNPEFTKFICNFGFIQSYGSFSDISIIAPYLGIAAVNISAGYYYQHTKSEIINITDMNKIIQQIIKLINTPSKKFDYIEQQYFTKYLSYEKDMPLMPLPKNSYLIINDTRIECTNTYLLDENRYVYDYIDEITAAIIIENATAYSSTGKKINFSKSKSVYVTTVITNNQNQTILLDEYY